MVAQDPRAEERVGSVLHDKWTLERLIGVGGMGAVYSARHRNGARAAVKILSPSSGRQPQIRNRFLREGYAANRVEHAGAVKVLDDDVIQEGPDEGTAYLVMELLDGESLHDRAKRDPSLTERDLLDIADGVLAVLDAAHLHGVVHRDLKPDNLFLARDPERDGTYIKVLDFGLARLLEAREQTIAGMALGTPTYMSPEQAAGHVEEIDGRTDIYALGSILFQLVSNKRIHDAAHTLGLVVRMATTPAPKLRSVAPEVSEVFARIVDHALEFKREDRYATAAAMRADVKAALERCGDEKSTVNVVPASVPPSTSRAVVGPATSATAPAPAAALADTVQMPAVARARNADARSTVAAEEGGPTDESGTRNAGVGRSPLRGLFLIAGAFVVGFLAWQNRAVLERWVAPPSTTTATAASSTLTSPTTQTTTTAADASSALVASDGGPEMDEDASSLSFGTVDAAADEASDASADGGDEDEEDDEDDDPDAAASNDASAQASPSNAAGPRRGSHPAAKPTQKKRPPRRPGQPRRRKKRWHW